MSITTKHAIAIHMGTLKSFAKSMPPPSASGIVAQVATTPVAK